MRVSKLSPLYRCSPLLVLIACDGDADFTGVKSPPAASIQSPAAGSFAEGSGIEFAGRVSDDADAADALILEWTSDRDGLLHDEPADSEGRTSFVTSLLTVGSHVVTLKATDSDGTSAEDWIELTVTDVADAPTIEVRSPENSDVGMINQAFEFEVAVSDAQDASSSLAIAFASDLDGTFCAPTADDLGIANCEYVLSVGEHALTFTVTDSDQNMATATTYFEVLSGDDVDDDGDGFSELQGDCDDLQPLTYPGANEIGDGADNDCDGDIDEGLASFDDDGDCYCEVGPCTGSIEPDCANVIEGDCNDSNVDISPEAYEVCDDEDNDCDDLVDEAGAEGADTWYRDKDGDLYGNAQDSVVECDEPAGYVDNSLDCNDSSAAIFPAAAETTGDGIDQDCDKVDSCYTDADNDGYGIATVVDGLTLSCANDANLAAVSGDCNDGNASIKPGAAETVADGIDQDCDNVDSCYQDNDNDTYGSATVIDGLTLSCSSDAYRATVATDCNDGNSSIKPGATEIVADGVDQDCDKVDSCYYDQDNDGYGSTSATVMDGSSLSCTTDAYRSTVATDCNDGSSSVNPAASETVGDSIDQNCDGKETCYEDADNDGYREQTGDTVVSADSDCSDNYEAVSGDGLDCNDNNSSIKPGATETVADGIDQDCDNVDSCYYDADNDGYGISTVVDGTSLSCTNDSYRATVSTDCNDGNSSIKPSATETIGDGIDYNCDGKETCYNDGDDDGYRSALSPNTTRASTDTDCNDAYEAKSSDPTTDCGDSTANARPNQTAYFTNTYTNNYGNASWDYDCDGSGSSEKQYMDLYTCESYYDFPDCEIGSYDAGWLDASPPACGVTGTWGYGISTYWDFGCECEEYGNYSLTQACR